MAWSCGHSAISLPRVSIRSHHKTWETNGFEAVHRPNPCQVRSCTFPVSWRVAAHPEISPTSHQDTFESPAMLTQAGYTPSSAYNILAVRSDECRGQSWDKGSGCTSLTLVLAARPAGLSRPLSMLSLEFFISRAVHHLSGFFKNDFWARTVSHAAFHQSGIRHTFLALSAVLG